MSFLRYTATILLLLVLSFSVDNFANAQANNWWRHPVAAQPIPLPGWLNGNNGGLPDGPRDDGGDDDQESSGPSHIAVHGITDSLLQDADDTFDMQCVVSGEEVDCFVSDRKPLVVDINNRRGSNGEGQGEKPGLDDQGHGPSTSVAMHDAIACEGAPAMRIYCKGGSISVVSAMYGRTRSSSEMPSCQGNANAESTKCVAVGALKIVQERCSRKTSCEIPASNGIFGDPCGGTKKYLEVSYECK